MPHERIRRQKQAPKKPQLLSQPTTNVAEMAPLDVSTPVYANGPQAVHRMIGLQRTLGNKATQQMMQRQPFPTRPRAIPSVQRALEMAKITGAAHLRKIVPAKPEVAATTTTPLQPAVPESVDTNTMVGHKIRKGTFIKVDTDRKAGDWAYAESMSYSGFIRDGKYVKATATGSTPVAPPTPTMRGRSNAVTENPEEESGIDHSLEQTGEMGGATGDMAGDIEEEQTEGSQGASDWGITGGSMGTLQGVAGLAKNIRAVLSANGGMEHFESIMELVGSGVQTGSGISKIVDAASDGAGSSHGAAGGFESANEIFSGVVSTYNMIKGIVVAAKALFKGQLTGDEAFQQGMEGLKNGLDASVAGIKAAKVIKDVFLEVPKSAMGGLNAAIPGLGIAISAVDIILQVYKIVRAGINVSKMNQAMQGLEGDVEQMGGDMVKTVTTSSFFSSIKKERKVVQDAKITARIDQLEAKAKVPTTPLSLEEQKQLKTLKEYQLAKNLKSLNVKRIVDSSVSIFADFLNIAGDIATLTGLAAPAGIALKMIAGTTKVTYAVVGKIVQYLRDRKAIKAGGKTAEMTRRDDAKLLIELVVALPSFDGSNIDVINQYTRVQNYLTATGVNIPALTRETDINKQFGMLVTSMRS